MDLDACVQVFFVGIFRRAKANEIHFTTFICKVCNNSVSIIYICYNTTVPTGWFVWHSAMCDILYVVLKIKKYHNILCFIG